MSCEVIVSPGGMQKMREAINENTQTIAQVQTDLANLDEVEFAHQIVTDDGQQCSDYVFFRTTGGDVSLTDGDAKLISIGGHSVHTGKVTESIIMNVSPAPREVTSVNVQEGDDPPEPPPEPITATLNRDEFVEAMTASGTIVFTYTTAWDVDPSDYGITVIGTPIDGDVITVVYVKGELGVITSSNPSKFVSTGWNLYNHTNGYAHVKKYSDDYGFFVGGTYTALQFSATIDGAKTTITPTDNKFSIPSDGYVWVTGGDDTTTYILMTWSDWGNGYEGDFQPYYESEIDFSSVMTNFPNGLMSVGDVADEINFSMQEAISRIERLANTERNMADIIASGRTYDYDADYIYAVRDEEIVYSISLSSDYDAFDHGMEFIVGGTVSVFAQTLYGRNIVDYIRHDVPQQLDELRNGLKVGEIKIFSGSTVPQKWKVCDGSVINRTTYSDLFTAIGTDWGGGDGETTFAIPDFSGRTPIGVGENATAGHTAHTLGQMAGEEKHTLTVAELASHSHRYIDMWTVCRDNKDVKSVSFDTSDPYYGVSTASTGSSSPHNNMQPYATCTFIIYTGVLETA